MFKFSSYEIKKSVSYQLFNNDMTTSIINGSVQIGATALRSESIIVGNDIKSVIKGNRTCDQRTHKEIYKLLTRQKSRNGFTPSLLDRVSIDDQAPDLFLNDGSKMCVGFFTTGNSKGIAVLSYLDGIKWKTKYASIELRNNDSGSYYTATFYCSQDMTADKAKLESKMSIELDASQRVTLLLEMCSRYGIDPDQLHKDYESSKKVDNSCAELIVVADDAVCVADTEIKKADSNVIDITSAVSTQIDERISQLTDKLIDKYKVYNSPKYITEKFHQLVKSQGADTVITAMRSVDGSLCVTIDEYIKSLLMCVRAAA